VPLFGFFSLVFFLDENKFNNINIIQKRVRNKNNMTTLSREYKLSKNILFYILQSMLSNMTSKQKVILFQNMFCYHAKYWDFSQLLPKTGGIKYPDCYASVLEYQSELYFYLYYMNLNLFFDYHQTSLSISSYCSWQQYIQQTVT
jgi:hypothetical protein